MIAAVINYDAERRSVLVVVIERDNLERMKKADPITLESTLEGGFLPPPRYPLNYSLLIAYEEDQDDLYRRAKGDSTEMLRWLERGRVFIPGVDGKSEGFITRRKDRADNGDPDTIVPAPAPHKKRPEPL